MRMRFGKDSKKIYGHFIVSPDPDDKVFAGECADVADEWAEAMLPGSEHTVVVHDDNKNGIIHAHVVVNTVHPKAGYKIQVSDGDKYRQWDKLQRICEDYGLVFHHPEGGEHAMGACAAKLGAEYTEDALRARLGADFDAIRHGKPSADVYVPPAARALRERHNVHALGSSWAPADRTMGDWALQRRALNPCRGRAQGRLGPHCAHRARFRDGRGVDWPHYHKQKKRRGKVA